MCSALASLAYECRLLADSVEKVENTAKTKFSQRLAGGRFLMRMRSSCEEEGRRKLLFKSTWSTVSDGVKRIRALKILSRRQRRLFQQNRPGRDRKACREVGDSWQVKQNPPFAAGLSQGG